MNLYNLVEVAKNKNNFVTIDDYAMFCQRYLDFIFDGLQAVIVSRNENKYRFFQYKEDGSFTVTRPINSELMLSAEEFDQAYITFREAIPHMFDLKNEYKIRDTINKFVYDIPEIEVYAATPFFVYTYFAIEGCTVYVHRTIKSNAITRKSVFFT